MNHIWLWPSRKVAYASGDVLLPMVPSIQLARRKAHRVCRRREGDVYRPIRPKKDRLYVTAPGARSERDPIDETNGVNVPLLVRVGALAHAANNVVKPRRQHVTMPSLIPNG